MKKPFCNQEILSEAPRTPLPVVTEWGVALEKLTHQCDAPTITGPVTPVPLRRKHIVKDG